MRKFLMPLLTLFLLIGGIVAFAGSASANRISCSGSQYAEVHSSGTTDCFVNSPGFDDYVQLPQTDWIQGGNSTEGLVDIYYYRCSNYTQTPGCSGTYAESTMAANGTRYSVSASFGIPYIDVVRLHYHQVRT